MFFGNLIHQVLFRSDYEEDLKRRLGGGADRPKGARYRKLSV